MNPNLIPQVERLELLSPRGHFFGKINNNMKNWKKDKKMFFEIMIFTVLIIVQIFLFIIFFNYGKILFLKYIGYFCWVLSAIFGWLPIYELKKKGKVLKGKNYVHTTRLVTSGVYNIVRHPQFLAGVLLSLAFILISQHWYILILGVPVMIILYKDMFRADEFGINKFGDDYKRYMEKVPRMNFFAGLMQSIKRKSSI